MGEKPYEIRSHMTHSVSDTESVTLSPMMPFHDRNSVVAHPLVY